MQEAQPIVQDLSATHCNEDATTHQSPLKRKTRLQSQSKQGSSSSQTTPSSQSKQGSSSSQTTPSSRSSRYTRSQATPDWTEQEVLVLLSKISAIDGVWLKELSSYQRWKMTSDSCMAMNVVRSSNQCKRKWEMLLDDYNKIMNWEPQSGEDSYWFLSEEGRKNYGLPVSFQKEVFDAVDNVIQVQQQQSDSNYSDPEQIISEKSKMKAGSEISMLCLPLAAHEEEVITSKSRPDVEELALKLPEKALVLTGDELITTSKGPEVEESILENQEKALVLAAGDELPEMGDLITILKSSTEKPEAVELNTTSMNLEERPEVAEPITTFKSPEVEELVTTSMSSEQRLEVEELNSTSKSIEDRPEMVELITASKIPEMGDLITTLKSPEKAFVMPVSEEEELITTSKSSVVEELITTSKSSEKASVMSAFKQEVITINSKISEKSHPITGKLQENAELVCAILRGELQDGASHCPSPVDSLKPSVAETRFARRQADELIKALSELTKSLDELSDHINRRECAGIAPVDSMALLY